jgi:hypothetical protein
VTHDPLLDNDLRSLPDRTLQLYLYGIGAWGLALLLLYVGQHTAWAIPLLYLVFVWQALLTGWWGADVMRRFDAGELTDREARAGVGSVGRIVAASALLPSIVFLVEDPLAAASWTAATGTIVVAGLAALVCSIVARVENRFAHIFGLAIASLALPINATGAVSLAAAAGFFDRILL